MKITKILALALIAASVASCKKTDLTENQAAAQSPVATTTAATTTAAPALSDWKTVSNWTSSGKQYSTTLADQAITGAIADKGLVLVFSKNQNNPELLPYSKDGVSWYYQVNKGAVTITATGASVAKGQQFQYLILSEEQLAQLEAKGETKFKLMGLSYENAMNLLK
jgi:hypothetical protein